MTFDVNAFAIVRVKCSGIDAESHDDAVKKAKQMEQHKGGEHVDSSDGHFVENISGE